MDCTTYATQAIEDIIRLRWRIQRSGIAPKWVGRNLIVLGNFNADGHGDRPRYNSNPKFYGQLGWLVGGSA